VLYLGLAVVTIAVLGTGGGSMAPLADLPRHAIGPAGTAAGAAAAIVLTLGAVNAYVGGAAEMAVELTRRHAPGPVAPGTRPPLRFLAVIAVTGLALISLYGAGLASPAALVAIPTALFLVVYLGCMTSAVRILRGPARWAAAPAVVFVAVVLAYCGWSLLAPAAVILAVFLAGPRTRERKRGSLYSEGHREKADQAR
jgi:amino acid efflux transporter